MAHTVESRISNPATDLRDALKRAEDQLVRPTKDEVESLLLLCDEIEQSFDTLKSIDLDLRAEQVRWQNLKNRLNSKPTLITSPANALSGMSKLRAQNPPAENFWWHLDDIVNGRRKKRARRLLITVSTIIGLLLLAYGIMTVFFPPSPEALVVLGATNSIEEDLALGNWAAARQTIENAINAAPEESELWLWDAVLSEQLDEEPRAQASQARARELTESDLFLLIGLANTRSQVGNLDGAEGAINEALALDPNSALATFMLAGIAETRGDLSEAIDLFEEASELAEASDDAQLTVMSRMRMGTLMQTLPALPTALPTVEAEQ